MYIETGEYEMTMHWNAHLDKFNSDGTAEFHHFTGINEPSRIKIGDSVSLSPDNFRTFPWRGTIIAVKEVMYYRKSSGFFLTGLFEFVCYTFIAKMENRQ